MITRKPVSPFLGGFARRRQRRAAILTSERRRLKHFPQPDVVDVCTKCAGPIFNQSLNAAPARGRRTDGTSKQCHVRCPERRWRTAGEMEGAS